LRGHTMRLNEKRLRQIIREEARRVLQEGDAVQFDPSRKAGRTLPPGEEGGEVRYLPKPKEFSLADHWEQSRREREAELRKPGPPARIPEEEIKSARDLRVKYAAYVVGRVAELMKTLERVYEGDTELMNLDPKWAPYTPNPTKKLSGKEWEASVVARMERMRGRKLYPSELDQILKNNRRYRREELAKSKAGTFQHNETMMTFILPNLWNNMFVNTGKAPGVLSQIKAVLPVLDKADPEEAILADYLETCKRALAVFEDLVVTKLPPSSGLNEAALRKLVRMIIEGDVINFDPSRVRSGGTASGESEVLQLPGRSEEELFQKKRPRQMAWYDAARKILDHPDVKKLLELGTPPAEPNLYSKLQPVSVKIGNKWYHVSGEEMKSMGVDPWAKESEPEFDI
jgi:hypothetical protein